jgi:hypothetical protein
MPTREMVNVEEAAWLELDGAVSRLLRARQELADFHAKNMIVTAGAATFKGSDALSESLERELRALLLEVDEAERQYRKSFSECITLGTQPMPR